MVRISVSVIVEHNGRTEQASSGGGGRYDYGYFESNSLVEAYTKEALRLAMVALESVSYTHLTLPTKRIV